MKICVFGAGSIGGVIGGVLANAGHDVSLIARGAHLEALRANGCRVETGGQMFNVHPAASDTATDFGPQDIVIVAVKAPAMPAVAAGIAPLLGPETAVVPAIPVERVMGCVVHMGSMVPEPGVIRHVADNRLILGEATGGVSDRLTMFASTFEGTTLSARVTDNLRQEIWLKLLGNFNFAPVSSLTGATNGQIGADPGLRKLCADLFEEAAEAGRCIGLEPGMTAEERTDLGASLGEFRTSMLQDFDKSRPPEIDAIVGAVVEIGRATGTPMSISESVLSLVEEKARGMGLY